MVYFKYIDILNFELIKQKTYNHIINTNHNFTGLYKFSWTDYVISCPEILTCMENYGIKTINAATYIVSEQHQSKIHIDYIDYRRPRYRLNIPIQNCNGSFTEFYTGGIYFKTLQEDKSMYKEIKQGYEKYCSKQTEVEIIRPTLISIQTPHRVRINPNLGTRICLSVYLDKDPIELLNN